MQLIFDYDINHPLPETWSLIANFGDVSWLSESMDSVHVTGQGIGMERTLVWKRLDHPSTHKLLSVDNEQYTLSYRMPHSHLRLLENAVVVQRLNVKPGNNGCNLQVSVKLDTESDALAAEARDALQVWADVGVDLIRKELDRRAG